MIGVQNLFRAVQVNILLGSFVPGKIQTSLQIGENDACFMGTNRHFGQAIAFLEKLFILLLRKLQLCNAIPQLICFLLRVVVIPQLIGDGFHLLTQIVFTLIFIHLFTRFFLNFIFDGDNFNLLFQNGNQLPQTLYWVNFVQNHLLAVKIEHDIRRNVIR